MFIISIIYKVELDIVEKFMEPHKEFMDKYYANGTFLFSGRKVPRTGGVIIANDLTKLEIEEIIKEDSFYINDIANYEITEFTANRFSDKIKIEE